MVFYEPRKNLLRPLPYPFPLKVTMHHDGIGQDPHRISISDMSVHANDQAANVPWQTRSSHRRFQSRHRTHQFVLMIRSASICRCGFGRSEFIWRAECLRTFGRIFRYHYLRRTVCIVQPFTVITVQLAVLCASIPVVRLGSLAAPYALLISFLSSKC